MSDPLPFDQVLHMLAAATTRIAAAAAGLSAAQLRTPPGKGEWSMNDVLAHLRACADMWGGSIKALLAEDRPTIRAINPRTWIRRTDYPALAFAVSFQAYAQQRGELLAVLKSLSPEMLARSGTFTGAGKPLERTVESFAHRIAIHERAHLKQIERAAKVVRG